MQPVTLLPNNDVLELPDSYDLCRQIGCNIQVTGSDFLGETVIRHRSNLNVLSTYRFNCFSPEFRDLDTTLEKVSNWVRRLHEAHATDGGWP